MLSTSVLNSMDILMALDHHLLTILDMRASLFKPSLLLCLVERTPLLQSLTTTVTMCRRMLLIFWQELHLVDRELIFLHLLPWLVRTLINAPRLSYSPSFNTPISILNFWKCNFLFYFFYHWKTVMLEQSSYGNPFNFPPIFFLKTIFFFTIIDYLLFTILYLWWIINSGATSHVWYDF